MWNNKSDLNASSFQTLDTPGGVYVCRRPGDTYDPRCVLFTVKSSGVTSWFVVACHPCG